MDLVSDCNSISEIVLNSIVDIIQDDIKPLNVLSFDDVLNVEKSLFSGTDSQTYRLWILLFWRPRFRYYVSSIL